MDCMVKQMKSCTLIDSESYLNFDDLYSFNNYGVNYSENQNQDPFFTYPSTSQGVDQNNFNEYAVSSSTVDIESYSEDTWSNRSSTTPDSFTYSSNEGVNDTCAEGPILHQALSTVSRTNSWCFQNCEQKPMQSQPVPQSTFTNPIQLCYPNQQHVQQFSQNFHYSQSQYPGQLRQNCRNLMNCCIPQQNQYPYQQPYVQGATNNGFAPMPNYQALRQPEVSWPMESPMVSVKTALPVTTSSCPAASSNQISSTVGSQLKLSSKKKAISQAPKTKLVPTAKTKRGATFVCCPHCQRPFKNKSNIKAHILCHTNEKPFECVVCNKCFRQKAHLTKHALIHQRQKHMLVQPKPKKNMM